MFIGVKNQQSKSCPSCMRYSYLTWCMSLPKIIKLSQTVWELWPAQDFRIKGDKYIMEIARVLLNTTCLLVLIYASTNYIIETIQIIKKLLHTQRIWLRKFIRGGNSCTWHTYWSLSMPLPNIKICWTIKLWSAQEFGLEIRSGEITRKRTGQDPYQILSTNHLIELLVYTQ